MGSHLQVGSNRIWFDPVNLVEGRIERLAVGQPHIVSAGWVESCYEPFARFLAQSQEVRPFTYDWRLSLQHASICTSRSRPSSTCTIACVPRLALPTCSRRLPGRAPKRCQRSFRASRATSPPMP